MKKVRKERLKKPPKLSRQELQLLSYPPTKATWVCENHKTLEGSDAEVINSGSQERCWQCTKPKPKKPKLIWGRYEAALAHQEELKVYDQRLTTNG